MKSQHTSIKALPKAPGVYKFLGKKGEVLYVGKATELRSRVKSYFGKDLINTRGPAILDMVTQASKVDFTQTDTVLEALILEAELIKRLQPKYNTKEKDNKSFLCVAITKPARIANQGGEELPKVVLVRKKDIDTKAKTAKILRGKQTIKIDSWYGPFTNGQSLKIAMRIIRRIFPYIDLDSVKRNNVEFYKQLNLSPKDNSYSKNIQNLKKFFEGKKQSILKDLKKEMNLLAKQMQFERANEIKKQIFALEHINDIALIREDSLASIPASQNRLSLPRSTNSARAHAYDFSKQYADFRIEAYDIAHMSGKNMVGVMVVLVNGLPQKDEYKKFNIKTVHGANDPAALHEVLERRFKHIYPNASGRAEWTMPSLIVVDGNKVQIAVAQKVLKQAGFEIPVVSVVKDDRHKAREILNGQKLDVKIQKQILLANSEAHRFAIGFHRSKARKSLITQDS